LIKEERHNVSPGLFVGIVIVLAIAGCSRQLPPGERNNFHPFGVEHASLHFEYFGFTRGSEDLYEDGSGLREVHDIHSEAITEKGFHPTSTYTVRDVSHTTTVDSVKMVEVRLIDKTMDSLFHLPNGDIPTPDGQFGSTATQRGYALRGDTIIVASGVSIKAHIWQLGVQQSFLFEFKGLIVGNKANINGNENELRLMAIDTTSPIDPARFEPPHGFPVMDLTKESSNSPGSQP
jgi:hypothetical protein